MQISLITECHLLLHGFKHLEWCPTPKWFGVEHDHYRREKGPKLKKKGSGKKRQKGRMNRQRHQRFGEQEEGSLKKIVSGIQQGRRAKRKAGPEKKGKKG